VGPGLSQLTAEELYRTRGLKSSMFMDKDISFVRREPYPATNAAELPLGHPDRGVRAHVGIGRASHPSPRAIPG